MFCPQCGARAEEQTKFCRSCGLKLSDHAQLLDNSSEPAHQIKKERLLHNGTLMLITSMFSQVLYYPVYRMHTSSHPKPPGWISLVLLGLMLAIPAVTGLIGLVQIICGGFFKNYMERTYKMELAYLEQKRGSQRRQLDLQRSPEQNFSRTEDITRKLQPEVVTTRKIEGE